MRAVLAAVCFLLPLPAGAGVFLDTDGYHYEIVEPPDRWFDKPAPRIETHVLPRETVFEICKRNTKKAGQVGCASLYGTVCDVRVAEDLPQPFRDAVLRHERAHCHGWGADHPVD